MPDPLFIDTHCHLEADDDIPALLQAAAERRVQVIAVGGNETLNRTAEASGTWFTQGLDWGSDSPMPQLTKKPKLVAVGELGFDFHYEQGPEVKKRQCARVEAQAAFAREALLPIVVHTREADELTCDVLRDLDLPACGVIHSYTGDIPFARKLLDLGYCISFSGIVTFRNADSLRETAKFVPSDRILVETDSPYLAPVPLRGRRNQPAFVREVAAVVAAVRGITLAELAEQTTANARRLFRLPVEEV